MESGAVRAKGIKYLVPTFTQTEMMIELWTVLTPAAEQHWPAGHRKIFKALKGCCADVLIQNIQNQHNKGILIENRKWVKQVKNLLLSFTAEVERPERAVLGVTQVVSFSRPPAHSRSLWIQACVLLHNAHSTVVRCLTNKYALTREIHRGVYEFPKNKPRVSCYCKAFNKRLFTCKLCYCRGKTIAAE